jgi:hypothetical protein
MKTSQIKLFFALFIIAVLLGACAENQTGNGNFAASNAGQTADSNVEIVAQDNIEDLDRIIKLPAVPLEATYSEINLNGKNSAPQFPAPNEKRFVAVLRFSTEDAAGIVASAEKYKPPVPSDVDAETWFPPELIAKSQETGDEYLKGVEYAANDFIQPPYRGGKLTRLNNTDYFVLELTSF